MLLNYETCITGKKCVLVPYRPEHVETYHEWMKDPHLLAATGSESLSLDEEISMQQSWRNDPEKCTFIVLSRNDCVFVGEDFAAYDDNEFVNRNLSAMVGDVNLFLSEEEAQDEDETDTPAEERNGTRPLQAELDIMIAETRYRRNGMGREAACLMMMYGALNLGIRRFFCKINEDNHASRLLFEKLGFHQCDYAECFRQVELELKKETAKEMLKCIQNLYCGTSITIKCKLRSVGSEQTES